MKKILIVLLLTLGANAQIEVSPKTKIALVKAVGSMALGVVLFPSLVIGDAQWQWHTDRDQCNFKHKIIVPLPLDKKIKVPCSLWFDKR